MSSKNNPILKSSKIRVGLTLGDPCGIGPAITLGALKILKGQANITVIGSGFVLAKAAKLLKVKLPTLKLVDLDNVQRKGFVFGRLNAAGGLSSLDYLNTALELLKENKLDCLVTCPISKEAVSFKRANFSGHTEYLAQKTGSRNPVMLLLNDKIKFSLVTGHIALKEVSLNLTKNKLENKICNTIKGLRELFLIAKPKLVICGINPHASDNGVIGTEEQDVIIPVLKVLRKRIKGATLSGPLAADTAIARAAAGGYDCVIAAYHDQALIPLKLTGFKSGVNLTLGLPFVRTSPLHGTAFDIAANPDSADCGSLVSAIKLAIKCTSNQKKA